MQDKNNPRENRSLIFQKDAMNSLRAIKKNGEDNGELLSSIIQGLAGIAEALGSIQAKYQGDWNETDTTAPSYILNKPTIPVVPVVSKVVAGTLDSDTFTPDSETDTFAGALEFISGGGIIYLALPDSDNTVYDMVVTATSEKLTTKTGVEWPAPAAEPAAEEQL